jgi:hypothetical protein
MIAHLQDGSADRDDVDRRHLHRRALVKRVDASGPKSALMVLQNPRVDMASSGRARRILRQGWATNATMSVWC